MKNRKSDLDKSKTKKKLVKVFQPLTTHQLESIVGGPETSRGTVTNVQHG